MSASGVCGVALVPGGLGSLFREPVPP